MVEIAWDPNTEPDLVGYRLYHSPVSGHYTLGDYLTEIPAGTESYTIEDLAPGTHFWVLTAYDTELNESGLSEEISISLE